MGSYAGSGPATLLDGLAAIHVFAGRGHVKAGNKTSGMPLRNLPEKT